MICYVFRFCYKSEVLTSGITYNLDKIYRKNNPLYCDDKNLLNEICKERDINFFDITLEYIEFGSEEEAKNVLNLINTNATDNIVFHEFISKTINFDKRQYLRFLYNRLETCRKINHYDQPLHNFLINNFNTSEKYIYFEERFAMPDAWEMFEKKDKKKYMERYIHLDKKYELSFNFFIKVFSGYELEEKEHEIIVKYKINSNKIPYLVASMYNSIIFISHTINFIDLQKVPINKNELPFYYSIKPLILYYTKEQYEKDMCFSK